MQKVKCFAFSAFLGFTTESFSAEYEYKPHTALCAYSEARGGNMRAFEELMELHTPVLLAIVNRMIKDPHLREELVNSAWAKAWHNLHSLKGKSEDTFVRWAKRILRNLCLDVLRRPRYSISSMDDSLPKDFEWQHGLYQDAGVIGNDGEHGLAELLPQKLSQIDAEHARILRLYYLEGRTTPEIAKALKRPKGTVQFQLWRARTLLARAYNGSHNGSH